MKANTSPLVPDAYYHIYNRGINGESIFKHEKHYDIFLNKYFHHVSAFVDTYAYCLLGNHFHLLVRLKSENEIEKSAKAKYGDKKVDNKGLFVARQFGHLFNGYSQVINKTCDRTGGLFETPFRRKIVVSDAYRSWLICYIHRNPENHGFIGDFKDYEYSSYKNHLGASDTNLGTNEVLDWFGGVEKYEEFHEIKNHPNALKKELIEFD